MAQQLVWKREFAIGIASIDDQHREIIRLFNLVLANPDPATYQAQYVNLGRLMEQHFQHEEALMLKYGVPNLAAHQAYHQRLKDDYVAFHPTTIDEATLGLIRGKIYRWIIDHIINDAMDRGIGEHLRRHGIFAK